MNSTPHGVTGLAPSSIITPAIDLNGGVLFPANTSSNLTRDSAEYIKELYSRYTEVVAAVQKTLNDNKTKVLAKRKSMESPTVFPVGSYCVASLMVNILLLN
jgi:hypothetical protein